MKAFDRLSWSSVACTIPMIYIGTDRPNIFAAGFNNPRIKRSILVNFDPRESLSPMMSHDTFNMSQLSQTVAWNRTLHLLPSQSPDTTESNEKRQDGKGLLGSLQMFIPGAEVENSEWGVKASISAGVVADFLKVPRLFIDVYWSISFFVIFIFYSFLFYVVTPRCYSAKMYSVPCRMGCWWQGPSFPKVRRVRRPVDLPVRLG